MLLKKNTPMKTLHVQMSQLRRYFIDEKLFGELEMLTLNNGHVKKDNFRFSYNEVCQQSDFALVFRRKDELKSESITFLFNYRDSPGVFCVQTRERMPSGAIRIATSKPTNIIGFSQSLNDYIKMLSFIKEPASLFDGLFSVFSVFDEKGVAKAPCGTDRKYTERLLIQINEIVEPLLPALEEKHAAYEDLSRINEEKRMAVREFLDSDATLAKRESELLAELGKVREAMRLRARETREIFGLKEAFDNVFKSARDYDEVANKVIDEVGHIIVQYPRPILAQIGLDHHYMKSKIKSFIEKKYMRNGK